MWVDAASQIMYSLAIGLGVLLGFSSYNDRKNPTLYRLANLIVALGEKKIALLMPVFGSHCTIFYFSSTGSFFGNTVKPGIIFVQIDFYSFSEIQFLFQS